jgi:hypothetical protein
MVEKIIVRVLESLMGLIYQMNNQDSKPVDHGTLLGSASHPYHPNRMGNVYIDDKQRLCHLYALGATNSGKTKFIESLIRQDILSMRGICLVDPHGDLTQNILKFIGSLSTAHDSPISLQEIGEKLILVEPFNQEVAAGFNPLEASAANQYPLVMELMGIFKRLWHDAHWGPRMDELLRNTFLTLGSNNLTLLEAKKVLTDKFYRQGLMENLNLPEVKDYWLSRYDSLSEKMQAVYREPILNRLSIFTTDSHIRSIIGQTKSTFNFRKAMDQRKWLLLNLSKGYLKENTYLLGALFIAKLQNAAMSRVDIPEHQRKPFYMYVDEFQNFIGEDFKTVLSEARKYGLSLTLAHQHLDQLDADLRSAILGNAGTQIIFRVSHRDASYLSPELSQKERIPIERRLIDLKMGQAYLKIKGERPTVLKTAYVPNTNSDDHLIERIKQASFSNYARLRVEVERDIQKRSEKTFDSMAISVETENLNSRLAPKRDFDEGLDGW